MRWSHLATLGALAMAAGGCTCGSAYPSQAAGAALQHDAAAVRLSRDLLPYIQNNLQSILSGSFPTDPTGEYVYLYLPEASDASANTFCDELGLWPDLVPPCGYSLRVRDGCIGPGDRTDTSSCTPDLGHPRDTYRSYLRIKIADFANHFSIDMEGPGPADTGGFRIRLSELPVDLSLGLYVNAGLLTGGITPGRLACLFEKAPGAASSLTIHALDISIQPQVEDDNGHPTLFATSIVHALDLGDLSVTSRSLATDQACTSPQAGLNCNNVCPLVNNALVLGSTGFNALDDLIAPVLPIIATPLANAALAFLWNKPLDLGGAIDVSQFGFVPNSVGTHLEILTTAEAGAFAVTQQHQGSALDPTMGMSLPMSAGAYADESACAPYVAPNPYSSTQLPNFTGSVSLVDPSNGGEYDENYHVGMALSESYLNQLAYAARASGLMCMRIGSSEDGAIATGSFVPNAGLLYLLAPPLSSLAPSSAPIFIGMTPGDAPIFQLGDVSKIGTDEQGNPQATSLLNVQLNRIGLEFHLFAFDEYIRVFALQADLGIGLSLTPQSDGGLSLSIDHITANNLDIGFNPFLPGLDFSHITQVLFNLIASALGTNGLSIDLPIASTLKQELGADFQVRVVSVRRDGPDDDILAAYLKVCAPADLADPSNRTCYDAPTSPARDDLAIVAATVGYVPTKSNAVRALGADTEPDGTVTLQLSHSRPVQVAVDTAVYGAWLAPDTNGVVRVRSPKLWVLGHHTLLVRTRDAHGAIDMRAAPLAHAIIVDSERPKLTLTDRQLHATDLVTPAEKIMFRVGTQWLSANAAQAVADTSPAGTAIVARDEAGNTSAPQLLDGPQVAGSAPERHGCRATGESAAWIVLAVYVSVVRRRSSARYAA